MIQERTQARDCEQYSVLPSYTSSSIHSIPCSYQRIYFRNLNHPVLRPSMANRRTEAPRLLGITPAMNRSRVTDCIEDNADLDENMNADNPNAAARSELDPNIEPCLDSETSGTGVKFGFRGHSRSHIFDGINLSKETAAFQLCDITDPMLEEMIEDEDAIRDECDVSINLLSVVSLRIKASAGTRRVVHKARTRADQNPSSPQVLLPARRTHLHAGGMSSALGSFASPCTCRCNARGTKDRKAQKETWEA